MHKYTEHGGWLKAGKYMFLTQWGEIFSKEEFSLLIT